MAKEKLLPCPFCGSDNIILLHKGNDHTQTKSVTVKCKKCICKRETGAIKFSLDWCEKTAITAWNTRSDTDLHQCPFEKACKCHMKDPCEGCETFAEHHKCQSDTELVWALNLLRYYHEAAEDKTHARPWVQESAGRLLAEHKEI